MEELEFSVLGPLEGFRRAVPLALGSPKQRAMLAVLLLTVDHSASLGELMDALWGDDLPVSASTTVRTYAWRLRQALMSERGEPGALVSIGNGYRMVLPRGAVDVEQAEKAAALAEQAGADGRLEQARDLLNGALRLWRGEPLNGIPGPFALRHRDRLAELRLTLLEERLALDVRLGRAARLIPELASLTAEHPLRERPHGLLMFALYRSGRQGDALAAFRAARQVLIDELGVEPGPELAQMHRRILDNDPALIAAIPPQRERGPWAGVPKPAQLPPDIPDFSGREHSVDLIRRALTDPQPGTAALVAVSGMAGIGKSVLSVHAAHGVCDAFPGGVLYADLQAGCGSPATPEAVLAHFLGALGVPPAAVPHGLAARSAMFRSMTHGRRVLIVLDDAGDAAGIRPLLPGSAGCAVLATSRRRLVGLAALVHVGLEVFEPAQALGLLGRIIGERRLAAEPGAARELVTHCGFLPLAVRIAAARLASRPAWSVRDLATRLADEDHRIDELTIGDLAVGSAFDTGFRQLSEPQARAFRRLAWSDGPQIATGAAAAALGVDPAAAEALLESLVDAAMVDSPAPGRYRYHALLRVFARRLADREPVDAGGR